MIRRGLQITFVVGIMALGAAPSCLATVSQNFPKQIVLQDFAMIGGVDYNGVYVNVSQSGTIISPAGWFQKYTTDGSSAPIVEVRMSADFLSAMLMLRPTLNAAAVGNTGYRDISSGWGSPWPGTFWNITQGGLAFISMEEDPDVLYNVAFPDWESASVKIPLGFALGMAFWAAAVALTIPMKWIKELASAAS
jgi:hypothetical protein